MRQGVELLLKIKRYKRRSQQNLGAVLQTASERI